MNRFFMGAFFLILQGCGGLKLTDCISNPKANNFICYNAQTEKHFNQAPLALDNWVFLSPADEHSFLMACKNHQGGIKVNVCVFAANTLSFTCFNEVSGKVSSLDYAQSENFIGFSPVDTQIILDYCNSLQ